MALVVFLILARQAYALAKLDRGRTATTLAEAHPQWIAQCALLLLLLSIVANKVFSPPYLLWVLPLVPLLDWRPMARWAFFLGMLAACVLTMRIFPDCFLGDIVQVLSRDTVPWTLAGPTP